MAGGGVTWKLPISDKVFYGPLINQIRSNFLWYALPTLFLFIFCQKTWTFFYLFVFFSSETTLILIHFLNKIPPKSPLFQASYRQGGGVKTPMRLYLIQMVNLFLITRLTCLLILCTRLTTAKWYSLKIPLAIVSWINIYF